MSLYQLRELVHLRSYRMVKFSQDWEVEAIYHVRRYGLMSPWRCTCKQAERSHKCKHRDHIIPVFLNNREKINTGWFYCLETEKWEPPITHPTRLLSQALKRREQ